MVLLGVHQRAIQIPQHCAASHARHSNISTRTHVSASFADKPLEESITNRMTAYAISANPPPARSRRGQALVEVTLLLPWIVFSFVAAFNFGIFAYSMISTESAARSAAMYASQSLTVAQSGSVVTQACNYVLGELGDAPGVGDGVTTCTSSPVTLTITARMPGSGNMNTVQVSVTYNTMQLIPLPGLMAGSLVITRTVEMPIRN